MNKNVIDLFAGVGGLSLGFEMAGFSVLLANEYDEEIANAYVVNHKKVKMIVDDITKIDFANTFLPFKGKVDVIIGGPPCQGFSQKGQRKLIDDKRNYLFRYFIKTVELLTPKYFVMENVPNILTSGKGLFKNEIIDFFSKLGYSISYGVVDASEFGVPQTRKRALIIGKKGKEKPLFPKGNYKKVTIWEAIGDLSFLESGEGSETQDYRMEPKSAYQKEMRKNSKVLLNHCATKHSKVTLKRLHMIPPNGGKELLPEEEKTKSIYSGTWTRMRANKQSVTITTRFDTPSSGMFTHPFLNRAITVREAARIQSFPDTFIFTGSKQSQMKEVGNAVPPKLAFAIAKTIIQDDMEETKKWADLRIWKFINPQI